MIITKFNDFLTKHREFVIAGFAVPASFIYQKCEDFGNWYFRTFRNTNTKHNNDVRAIQKSVKDGSSTGKPMCTARKPWKSMSIRLADFKAEMYQVPINLRNVLEVDEQRQIVRAEPMVTMGDITHFLVPRGFALAVQAEMDDLTLGGLCMGVGIETSSHRHGFLFETVEAYEVVAADGTLIRATREHNADLFHALPWSHGTLGFLVAVELKIVPIMEHVKLHYEPCSSLESFCERLNEMVEQDAPPLFIEGLLMSKDHGVIVSGDFAPLPSSNTRVNRINRYYKPWFHDHAAKSLERGSFDDYVPVRHYFHRHTPSVFFQLKDLVTFADKPWYRHLWAWMGAPKISLMKFTMTRDLRRQAFEHRVAQDILVPIEDLEDAVVHSHRLFTIYPLWVCPVRIFDHGPREGFLRNPAEGKASRMYVDLGIYGIPKEVESGSYNQVNATRQLEKFVRGCRGYQMLYADICMTRNEFEEMFEHRNYRAMRIRYKADKAFPDVYEKVKTESWIIDAVDAKE